MSTPTLTKADPTFTTVQLRDAAEPQRELLLPDGYRLEQTPQGWRAHGPDGWTGPERTHDAVRAQSRQLDRTDSLAAVWAAGDACDREWCTA
jgi:hypothetical protein